MVDDLYTSLRKTYGFNLPLNFLKRRFPLVITSIVSNAFVPFVVERLITVDRCTLGFISCFSPPPFFIFRFFIFVSTSLTTSLSLCSFCFRLTRVGLYLCFFCLLSASQNVVFHDDVHKFTKLIWFCDV